MFGKRIDLFRLFGITIRIDPSWLILAVLVTWSLAVGVFPVERPGLSTATYWILGGVGAVGLFVSILVHEFFHAMVANRRGIPMKGITLFIFGGVAEMEREPPSAKAEFQMAIAGPIASILIAVLCYGVLAIAGPLRPTSPGAVIEYLGFINLLLAGFNLLPAFPLDGGRILRAALWHWQRNLRRATRIASTVGSGFGLLLIGLGVIAVITGNFIGGMWWFLIGLFLRTAAQASYRQVLMRQALEGEPISRFVKTDPVTISHTTPLDRFVHDYVYRFHHKLYPVVDDGRLTGCITTQQVKGVPSEEWGSRTVGDLAVACSPANSVAAGDDALEALGKMRQHGISRLLVVDGPRLVGVLTLKDLLEFFALKIDLEG